MITVGSLFSGIGGLELGLERTGGFKVIWQVEIDDYCQKVLAKHWPDVPRYADIRECHGPLAHTAQRPQFPTDQTGTERGGDARQDVGRRGGEAASLPYVDLICGGFPCQPHSVAGKRKASADDRDLWGEFYRIICEVRPRWVLAENVPGLLSSEAGRFFGRVLRDLASAGYDAEWHVLSAAEMGAPHLRKRVFIVAHTERDGSGSRRAECAGQQGRLASISTGDVAHAPLWQDDRRERGELAQEAGEGRCCDTAAQSGREDVAHRNGSGQTERGQCAASQGEGACGRVERGGSDGDAGQEPDGGTGQGADVPHAHRCIEGGREQSEREADQRDTDIAGHGAEGAMADATLRGQPVLRQSSGRSGQPECRSEGVADTDLSGCEQRDTAERAVPEFDKGSAVLPYAASPRLEGTEPTRGIRERQEGLPAECGTEWWATEPDLGFNFDGISSRLGGLGLNAWGPGWEDGIPRVSVGVKDRVNKLRCLGNAVVPACAEYVGRYILELDRGNDEQTW